MGEIVSFEEAAHLSKAYKNKNYKIVLTHGAFDVFHLGYSNFLKNSLNQGDVLFVGVECDERIAKYKGKLPEICLKDRVRHVFENNIENVVFPIDFSTQVNPLFYKELYSVLNVDVVTFGQYFSYQFEVKNESHLSPNVKFVQISHEYDEIRASSKQIKFVQDRL